MSAYSIELGVDARSTLNHQIIEQITKSRTKSESGISPIIGEILVMLEGIDYGASMRQRTARPAIFGGEIASPGLITVVEKVAAFA